jgi:thiamine biosynthesis lipoprotein
MKVLPLILLLFAAPTLTSLGGETAPQRRAKCRTPLSVEEGLGANRYEFQHPQMGTIFRLVFYCEKDSAQAASVARAVFDRVDTLNAIFSDWLPESELNRLCATAGSGQKVKVSDELFDILLVAKKIAKESGGAFDATVGPLTRLWRRARSLKELPTEARIVEARARVGWRAVEIFRKEKKIRLQHTKMQLDLGGIAQGWAADECLKILEKQGVVSALADAGGDIALGAPPPGELGWRIAIPAADGSEKTLRLAHCGITSSGAQYRYLEAAGGARYSHIVDPRTGWGLTHRNLTTVQAPSATQADAWATAISVLGESGWARLQKRHSDLTVWLAQLPL